VHLQRELAQALAAADVACVTEIYAAREEPLDDVSGKLVVDRLAEIRPGMAIVWAPAVESGATIVADLARERDLIVTIGAGDVDRAVPVILESLRA
jgi:UDP-N-acetylmuramate--alanine ligase